MKTNDQGLYQVMKYGLRSGHHFWPKLLGLWLASGLLLSEVVAQPVENLAYNKVQAAYIYKIANFVTWPDSLASSFIICIVGKNDSLASILRQATSSRSIQKRPVDVLSFPLSVMASNGAELKGCQLIYWLDKPPGSNIEALLSALNGSNNMLFISAPEVQMDGNALFELEVEEGRIVIYINRKRLSASKLVVAPPLLSVARPR